MKILNDKIVRIPIDYKQRKINEFGDGYVPCEVSDRWLQFPKEMNHEKLITVDIMTKGKNDEHRKLTELIISREDLLRAINSVKHMN